MEITKREDYFQNEMTGQKSFKIMCPCDILCQVPIYYSLSFILCNGCYIIILNKLYTVSKKMHFLENNIHEEYSWHRKRQNFGI